MFHPITPVFLILCYLKRDPLKVNEARSFESRFICLCIPEIVVKIGLKVSSLDGNVQRVSLLTGVTICFVLDIVFVSLTKLIASFHERICVNTDESSSRFENGKSTVSEGLNHFHFGGVVQ